MTEGGGEREKEAAAAEDDDDDDDDEASGRAERLPARGREWDRGREGVEAAVVVVVVSRREEAAEWERRVSASLSVASINANLNGRAWEEREERSSVIHPSIHPSIHSSIHPSFLFFIQLTVIYYL